MINDIYGILKRATKRAWEENISEAAASLAFFSFLSIIPLILILVAISSYVLKDFQTQFKIVEIILELFPSVSRGIIKQNLFSLLQIRGTVSIIGAITLLWTATSMFSILIYNLNRAWLDALSRGFIKSRIIAFFIVGLLTSLLLTFFFIITLLNLYPVWEIIFGVSIMYIHYAKQYFQYVVLHIFVLITFTCLYRWAPKRNVQWKFAFVGSMVATTFVGLTTLLFSNYISSGISKYNVIYGSLGAIVAFLSWLYLTNFIVIFSAHIGAATARRYEK
ncbi:MAG: YihY/virulence factor BrkB family protein [Desulfobacterales bacterium]|nr:YihY/virulence factor BrkB family protein [Desulfobacterales bacterium]MCP4158633.1 YihY/virulence factor BrkB family protein [Deltaproteobacteria bacterium]